MIIILSPSKTQKIAGVQDLMCTQPALLEHSAILIKTLRQLSKPQLSELMRISDKLTNLTIDRINRFTIPHDDTTAGAALKTFQGDAFAGIDTNSYKHGDYVYANTHVRILSGLYGVLRPLDLMQPYRLEMGSKLLTERGTNLYQFWGTTITEVLNTDLQEMKYPVVINCASKEYSRAVKSRLLSGDMITISFKQRKGGRLKSIAIYAKRARGMFVDFIIKNRIENPEHLPKFDYGGYRFESTLSGSRELVFITDIDS